MDWCTVLGCIIRLKGSKARYCFFLEEGFKYCLRKSACDVVAAKPFRSFLVLWHLLIALCSMAPSGGVVALL
jgi:hypothetical protein